MPVSQVCLVLSVHENGSDWQLTHIALKRSDLSRTLDHMETCIDKKSRVLVSFPDPKPRLEPIRETSLCRTLERKIQFWAACPRLHRSSQFCELCEHVKTRGFGRNFP